MTLFENHSLPYGHLPFYYDRAGGTRSPVLDYILTPQREPVWTVSTPESKVLVLKLLTDRRMEVTSMTDDGAVSLVYTTSGQLVQIVFDPHDMASMFLESVMKTSLPQWAVDAYNTIQLVDPITVSASIPDGRVSLEGRNLHSSYILNDVRGAYPVFSMNDKPAGIALTLELPPTYVNIRIDMPNATIQRMFTQNTLPFDGFLASPTEANAKQYARAILYP